jgi:hypothetical protein
MLVPDRAVTPPSRAADKIDTPGATSVGSEFENGATRYESPAALTAPTDTTFSAAAGIAVAIL